MSNQKGWISIHRKLQDNWIWVENEPFDKRSAWIDLILLANHDDVKVPFNNEFIIVKRGSKITSLRQLSKRWKWSMDKTKKFLQLLQTDGMLTFKSDNRKTTYTIVNYNVYQGQEMIKPNTNRTQTRHKPNTNRTLTETNNNDNNDNNDNKVGTVTENKFLQIWNNNFKQKINATDLATLYTLPYSETEILETLSKATRSSFLKGSKGFKMNIKFFSNPKNFEKIKRGDYSDKVDVKNNKQNLYKDDDRMTKEERLAFIEKKLNQPIPMPKKKGVNK